MTTSQPPPARAREVIVQRKVFTLAAFEVAIGDRVGNVTWERIVPGSGWFVISRGFDHGLDHDGPSRGMWLKLQKEPWHVSDADVAAARAR